MFSSLSQASPCLLPLGLAGGCGSLVGGPTTGTRVIRKAWGLGRRSLCPSAASPALPVRSLPPQTRCSILLPPVVLPCHPKFVQGMHSLGLLGPSLSSSETCLGTYGLVAAKFLVSCQGYLVSLAPAPSLTLACLPTCSQSSSGLCNNPPNQWSFPQAFVPCCILQSGREGTHGRGRHHPLYKSQPLPLLLSFSWSGWVAVAVF